MSEDLRFADRSEFRKWLQDNASSDDVIWLIFGKAGGPKTLKACEALEEALCFGWIDEQMQKIDDVSNRKYFSQRRPNSKWLRRTRIS
ncbi:hypothetical protein AALA21_04535 [Eggerthellaceae bacterium 3-80]